jgi:hypothetical protein
MLRLSVYMGVCALSHVALGSDPVDPAFDHQTVTYDAIYSPVTVSPHASKGYKRVAHQRETHAMLPLHRCRGMCP